MSADTTERVDRRSIQDEARQTYRMSVAAGNPVNGVQLGKMFDRSARWGRLQIEAVTAESEQVPGQAELPIGPEAEAEVSAPAPDVPAEVPGEAEPVPGASVETADEPDASPEPSPAVGGNVPDRGTNAEAERAGTTVAPERKSPHVAEVTAAEAEVSATPEPASAATAAATTPAGHRGARVFAFLGVAVGIAASIGGNVAHSFVPPAEVGRHTLTAAERAAWSPSPIAIVAAAIWPLALFLAIEIMSRVPWPAGAGWRVLRYGAVGIVAGVAAVISYEHLSALLGIVGEDVLGAHIGPLAVDGLMIVSGFGLLASRAKTQVREGVK